MAALISQQQSLHMKVNEVAENQRQILSTLLRVMPNADVDIAEVEGILKPMQRQEEVANFDNMLKNDAVFRKKVVSASYLMVFTLLIDFWFRQKLYI